MKKRKFLLVLSVLFAIAAAFGIAGCQETEQTENNRHIKHEWGAWINVEGEEPTCESPGKRYRVCKVCEEKEAVSIAPALGHDWGVGERVEEPTCSVPGKIIQTCKRDPSHTKPVILPMLGHELKSAGFEVEPTCITSGYEKFACARESCEYTERREVKEYGHKWGEWEYRVAPTCTSDGESIRVCERCSTEDEPRFEAATGHDWTEWVFDKAVTCTENGHKSRSCGNCQKTEEENVGRAGHLWGEWEEIVPASCTQPGQRKHTCLEEGCNASVTEDTMPLGHKWTITVIQKPTETETGRQTMECETCKKAQQKVLPALRDCVLYRVSVRGLNGRRIRSNDNILVYIYDQQGELAAGGPVIFSEQVNKDGAIVTREISPRFDAWLPEGDYTVELSNIPYGFEYLSHYELKAGKYITVTPEGEISDDPSFGAETQTEFCASLTITLGSHILDGRLPSYEEQIPSRGYGGIYDGAVLPDFALTDIDGNIFTLSELLRGKEMVIFYSFSLDNESCEKAAEEFVRFAEHFRDKISVVIIDFTEEEIDDCKKVYEEPYLFPSWFRVVKDYANRFYMNFEHFNKDPAPGQWYLIDSGACVVDSLGYNGEETWERIFMNFPDGFNRDFAEEAPELIPDAENNETEQSGEEESEQPILLPGKKNGY